MKRYEDIRAPTPQEVMDSIPLSAGLQAAALPVDQVVRMIASSAEKKLGRSLTPSEILAGAKYYLDLSTALAKLAEEQATIDDRKASRLD